MANERYVAARKTVLSAAIITDGERGDTAVVKFCEGNPVQFSASISERSGEIIRHVSIASLYRIGKRYGGVKFNFPKGGQDLGKTILAGLIGEDQARALVNGLGTSGEQVVLPMILAEFHTFYSMGFVAWADGCGKPVSELALALGGCERSVYNYRGKLRRARRPLTIAPFAGDFARYWAMIFPNEAEYVDFPATAPAEADSSFAAPPGAPDLLNAKFNGPGAIGAHAEGVGNA
ncbi:hypothetical protein [Paramagnetospirillum magneticum]|uniref:Uncharacterized protein n=1 Tax=Paramagnetospirillum magneticum (strain ATCC 700264 / AMB-1) TaxID=342108 RepID=Q2W6I3_PARM1|nr:hypothetical protein [Paramagnetospirillum magneticum]BAE50542.1 hypothetical protein amb1738 [Paramagnetospirillum magneticum AMB-1]